MSDFTQNHTYADVMDLPPLRQGYELMRIVGRASPTVRLYHAGNCDRVTYPYRLQPADEANIRQRETAIDYIVDSGFNKDHITNEFVIEKAVELDATYVVPKDYPPRPPEECDDGEEPRSPEEARRMTTESYEEFFDLYDKANCSATPIVVLQPDHVTHLETITERFGHFGYYGIGGIAYDPVEDKIDAMRSVRDAVGPGVRIHGFGLGTTFELIQELKHNPNLLDSTDTSRIQRNAVGNYVMDKYQNQHRVDTAKGDSTTSINGLLIAFEMGHLNYILSPLCDDDEIEAEYERVKTVKKAQAGIHDF